MMTCLVCAGLMAGGFIAGTQGRAEARPFTTRDLVGLHRLSDPAVLPNGRMVAFLERLVDLDGNKASFQIRPLSLDGAGIPAALGGADKNVEQPAWSADGSAVLAIPTVPVRSRCGALRMLAGRRSG